MNIQHRANSVHERSVHHEPGGALERTELNGIGPLFGKQSFGLLLIDRNLEVIVGWGRLAAWATHGDAVCDIFPPLQGMGAHIKASAIGLNEAFKISPVSVPEVECCDSPIALTAWWSEELACHVLFLSVWEGVNAAEWQQTSVLSNALPKDRFMRELADLMLRHGLSVDGVYSALGIDLFDLGVCSCPVEIHWLKGLLLALNSKTEHKQDITYGCADRAFPKPNQCPC